MTLPLVVPSTFSLALPIVAFSLSDAPTLAVPGEHHQPM